MNRRDALKLGLGFSAVHGLAAWFGATAAAGEEDAYAAAYPKDWRPFSETALLDEARALAAAPYRPPVDEIPEAIKAWSYDDFRSVAYDKPRAVWGRDGLGFNLELFHSGYIYRNAVQIFIVDGEKAGEFRYRRQLFRFGAGIATPAEGSNPGFSGFRIHAPIGSNPAADEFVVFQGASYLRSKAAGQDYGLSARGLAIDTGLPHPEEFPIFRSFYVVRPAAGSRSITAYALLDSVRIAGVYKFVIANSGDTVMDVSCSLIPRAVIERAGIAPLTSMFFYAPSDRRRFDDARQRVHDSDGLAILNARGEWIWRPLTNPMGVQTSHFVDSGVKGFGLLQRERRAERYEDLDVPYERRPSLWVEPRGAWGEGSVDLVEIPTENEYLDNIVAFWHPREPLNPGRTYAYSYRMSWCETPPARHDRAIVSQTLVGISTRHREMRFFNVDFSDQGALGRHLDANPQVKDWAQLVQSSASSGSIVNVGLRRTRAQGSYRLGFEYLPASGARSADLRCALVGRDGVPLSEVWIYRWNA